MRRRYSVRPVVVTALLAVLVAGCNGGEEPSPSSTPSSTPTTESAAASPTATATPSPKRETVKQFLKRWAEASAEMQNTGETSGFESLAHADCASCTRLIKQVRDTYAAGGRIETGPWRLVEIRERTKVGSAVVVTFVAQGHPATLFPTADSEGQHYAGSQDELKAELVRSGSTWKIRYYALVA